MCKIMPGHKIQRNRRKARKSLRGIDWCILRGGKLLYLALSRGHNYLKLGVAGRKYGSSMGGGVRGDLTPLSSPPRTGGKSPIFPVCQHRSSIAECTRGEKISRCLIFKITWRSVSSLVLIFAEIFVTQDWSPSNSDFVWPHARQQLCIGFISMYICIIIMPIISL